MQGDLHPIYEKSVADWHELTGMWLRPASRRPASSTALRLFDIKCAWFNEKCYNEFFPRLLLPRPARSDQSGRDTILTAEK
jgi:hypothetical protein